MEFVDTPIIGLRHGVRTDQELAAIEWLEREGSVARPPRGCPAHHRDRALRRPRRRNAVIGHEGYSQVDPARVGRRSVRAIDSRSQRLARRLHL